MVGFKVVIFTLTLFSFTTWVQAKHIQNNVGIIGGHDISIEETPYVVALNGSEKKIRGAGSIVHEQFILTSASFVEWAIIHGFRVVVGSDNLSTGENFNVVQALCHQGYDGKVNDICLLKLSTPVTLGPKVGIITLADKDFQLDVGVNVNITGWGEIEDTTRPDKLQQTQVPLLPDRNCTEMYPMDSTMICAFALDHDTCGGDSGGPMTYNNVQIGVAVLSYSNYCGKRPSVYTKVSKYVDWINATISQNL